MTQYRYSVEGKIQDQICLSTAGVSLRKEGRYHSTTKLTSRRSHRLNFPHEQATISSYLIIAHRGDTEELGKESIIRLVSGTAVLYS